MHKKSKARKIVESPFFASNRMDEMHREMEYYIEQMQMARNGILKKSFCQMASVYFARYMYYFKKCTGYESGKSIQTTARKTGACPEGDGREAWDHYIGALEDRKRKELAEAGNNQ